jgi:hypothetical protein
VPFIRLVTERGLTVLQEHLDRTDNRLLLEWEFIECAKASQTRSHR